MDPSSPAHRKSCVAAWAGWENEDSPDVKPKIMSNQTLHKSWRGRELGIGKIWSLDIFLDCEIWRCRQSAMSRSFDKSVEVAI